MVVRPDDLMGRAGAPDGDSRRQGALIEQYRSGTPNEKFESGNASEVGGN
jgi:type IV pilus biogenesis protein CpaD/CtpE